MTKLRAFVVAMTLVFAVNTFGGCVRDYMKKLEICIHTDDLIDANICHLDATTEYVGCLRSTLLF